MERECCAARQPLSCELTHFEQRLARRVRDSGKQFVETAANHEGGDLRIGRRIERTGPGQFAIAQDGVGIADLANLFQKMTDVDDRPAFGAEPANHVEEAGGIGLRERAGRFIEDEDPGIEDQGAGDFDQLLHAD